MGIYSYHIPFLLPVPSKYARIYIHSFITVRLMKQNASHQAKNFEKHIIYFISPNTFGVVRLGLLRSELNNSAFQIE